MTVPGKLPLLVLISALTLFARAPAYAMGKKHTAPNDPGTEQKKSEFGSRDPIGQSPADKGKGSGDSGSGSDAEAGPVGNDAAVQGANTGTTSNMNSGMDPVAPSGQSGAPAEPGAGSR